jgi:hypothetical protein
MDRNNLPGLTPVGLILLTTILAAFVPIAVPFVFGSDTVKASDWLGFAGSIITAGVAAIAIRYAWQGIKMQTELDIISREEERMEALLPGLEAALVFLTRVHSDFIKADFKDYRFILERSGLWLASHDGMRAMIEQKLPSTDASTRRRIIDTMHAIRLFTDLYISARSVAAEAVATDTATIRTLSAAKHSLVEWEASLQIAKEDFDRLVNETMDRRALFMARMPHFRARIEASFGGK